jgi:tRNA-specific 2-thiouridylase
MKRVLVGMSGGVDSSVAALLLKQQGYEVIGVTLNLWSYEDRQEPYNECCSLEVRAVAQQLGIEHHFVDAGKEFKERVVDVFLAEHAQGRTPSPCGRCNRLVRFPILLELADRFGCDFLATGHHARIAAEDGIYYLLTSKDPLKDQSYFLYGLTQEQLKRILFPVGDLLKSEVWQIAKAHNLVSARKPESMDLCFIPKGDYRAYLRAHLDGLVQPGEIVDTSGRVVGRHEGLAFYTIGQRHGLGVALGERVYVVGFDYENNRLIVGDERALLSEGLIATDVNFIYSPSPLFPLSLEGRGDGGEGGRREQRSEGDTHHREDSLSQPARARNSQASGRWPRVRALCSASAGGHARADRGLLRGRACARRRRHRARPTASRRSPDDC